MIANASDLQKSKQIKYQFLFWEIYELFLDEN